MSSDVVTKHHLHVNETANELSTVNSLPANVTDTVTDAVVVDVVEKHIESRESQSIMLVGNIAPMQAHFQNTFRNHRLFSAVGEQQLLNQALVNSILKSNASPDLVVVVLPGIADKSGTSRDKKIYRSINAIIEHFNSRNN